MSKDQSGDSEFRVYIEGSSLCIYPRERSSLEDIYLRLEKDTRRASIRGKEVDLTQTEFRILSILALSTDRFLSSIQLLDRCWGEYRGSTELVYSYILKLRRKIEEDPSNPRYIISRKWVGYRYIP